MSTLSDYVYTGVWINWSQGSLLGSTLTLSSQQAGYLSSALGVFVTLVGSQAWVVLSYIIHQINAKESSDGLKRQQQIILRNSGSAAGVVWQLICLPFAWRHSGPNPSKIFPPSHYLGRSVLPLLPALITFVAFSAAGVFSSQINKAAGNEVLLSGDFCGQWTFLDTNTENYVNKLNNDTLVAANYARYCYGGGSTLSSLCGTYRQQQVFWSVNQNATCPFQAGLCQFSNNAALQLDTGYMDSHRVLGLNSAPADRVNFRRVTTCAPLTVQGRVERKTIIGDLYYDYNFGKYGGPGNVTIRYPQLLADQNVGYQVFQFTSSGGDWDVTPEMARDDADVTLFGLATNGVSYFSPVYDPFFAATMWDNGSSTLFYTANGPDEYVHFAGCTDQYQFCSATDDSLCTPLTALNNLITSATTMIWATSKQTATVDRLILSLARTQMYYSTLGRDGSALLANEKLVQVISSSIPNNQWMVEIQEWFAVSLARMQHALVEFVTGPPVKLDGMSFITMNESDSKALCQAQIVRMPGQHQSFSMFGLMITVILGLLIILLSLTIESIGSFIRTRWMEDPKQKRIQWILDGKLQLLRMAEEYAGRGTWTHTAEDVPVTVERDEIFRLPNNLDPDNPGLRSSRGPSEIFMDGSEYTNSTKVMLSSVKEDRKSRARRIDQTYGAAPEREQMRSCRETWRSNTQRHVEGYQLVNVDQRQRA